MLLSVPGKVLNRILLERMREAVDPMLRDQQAGFRRNRSCADQIASLRIIVEQSLEWNSPLYINFIDYEKAFDSVDREALWKLLRHYGVPGKIISLIQCTYQDMSCRIAHRWPVVRKLRGEDRSPPGMPVVPVSLPPGHRLDHEDHYSRQEKRDTVDTPGRSWMTSTSWTTWRSCLTATADAGQDYVPGSHISRNRAQDQQEENRADEDQHHCQHTSHSRWRAHQGGGVFVYLGSVVNGQGGTDRDVTARIGKARAAMVMLKNVWASKVVSIRTKLRIFNSNVKSVLLYGCETWRTTKTMQQKIQTFLNTCLRRIFNIRWPEKIRNEELWERAGQEPVAKQILKFQRKWGWIGHTLRKPASSTTRQALTWNPQGKRKRGRPRNSWRRDTEAELCKQGTNWTGVARLAQNRVRWRRVVDGLCSTWSQGPK
nr:hypothetical protein BaRGS_022841 [Batillaria attramentaria]